MSYINRKVTQQIPVKALTEATTLTVSQSGTTFVVGPTSGSTGYAITLPPMADGTWSFRFFAGVAPTGTAYTIEADADDADKMVGQVFSSTGGDADSEVTLGADKVTFAAGTAVISDSCDIFTDGTAIYVRAFCNADAGITLDG